MKHSLNKKIFLVSNYMKQERIIIFQSWTDVDVFLELENYTFPTIFQSDVLMIWIILNYFR